jgi:hypothetical protein
MIVDDWQWISSVVIDRFIQFMRGSAAHLNEANECERRLVEETGD